MYRKGIYAIILFILCFSLTAHAAKLVWDANTETDLAGYKVYRGQSTGSYDYSVDVGNITEHQIEVLAPGTYYYAVTAYNTSGGESGYSNEVVYVQNLEQIAPPTNLRITLKEKVQMSNGLTVHTTNPRYFQDSSGKLVYLTGSHTWDNLMDFTRDPHIKALWRLDAGALTIDSKGTNILTNVGVAGDTVNHMEGDGCGDWEASESDRMYITNANWNGPWKSTDSVKKGSVFARLKLESLPSAGYERVVFAKLDWDVGEVSDVSISMGVDCPSPPGTNSYFYLALGYNGGDSNEWIRHATPISAGVKYYVLWSYDDSNRAYAIRVRDENGDVVGTDLEGTAANNIYVNTQDVSIGYYTDNGAPMCFMDGLMDEIVVFDNIKTAAQTTKLAQGIYPSIDPFDFTAYLDFLDTYNHNFIRLWAREVPKTAEGTCRPQPWTRTGPGTASDGLPEFDLDSLNQAYFDRLRARVVAAGARGIYVGVMLFEGSSLRDEREAYDGFPFTTNNNVDDINAPTDTAHTLTYPAVTAIQKLYVEKVIDTLNDLDNVLWEIANEDNSSSVAWQEEMISHIRTYEAGKAKQHPIGMTASTHFDDDVLFASDADWISPGEDNEALRTNPPASTGDKVSLLDTDHIGWDLVTKEHVWKAFCRGHNSIFMDTIESLTGAEDPPYLAELRLAGKYIKGYADKIDLAHMIPQATGTGTPSETNYCLYSTGHEYLFYQPDAGGANFEIVVPTKKYHYEWFNITTGLVHSSGIAEFSSGDIDVPFNGPAVLWLREQKEIQGAFRGINRGIARGVM